MRQPQVDARARVALCVLVALGTLLGATAVAGAETAGEQKAPEFGAAAVVETDRFVAIGHPWPYVRWVSEARVPGPPGLVVIKHYADSCLLRLYGCMIWKEPPVVRLGPKGRNKLIFFHELGHAYDYRALDWGERAEFGALNPEGWSSEAFADAYRNCAIGDRTYHVPYGPHSGWAPAPRWRHRAACELIRDSVDPAR